MSDRMVRLLCLALMLGIFAWPCAAQERAPAGTAKSELTTVGARVAADPAPDRPALQKREQRYHLQSGDALDLDFPFTPEFNQTLTVGPDGYIALRDLGDLRAEGRTTHELAETLRSLYGKILHDPVITVELKDFEKPYFIVGGEVEHPGKFNLRGGTTLSQAIAIAGGFRDSARHSQVLLFRRVSDDWAEARKIDLKKMLRSGNLGEDPQLEPGDMLFVPKNTISKVKPFIPVLGLGTYFNPTRF